MLVAWVVVGALDDKIIKVFGPWDSKEDAIDYRTYLLDLGRWRVKDLVVHKLEQDA